MITDKKSPKIRTVLVNGVESDQIALADRGFQYGDGLFETIAVDHGVPEFLDRHLHRLRGGCARLAIAYPGDEILSQEAIRLSRDHATGVLKIIITRGAGGRGYRIQKDARPTRVLAIYPRSELTADLQRSGIRALLCKYRLGINPALAGIKHLNRLEQILARSEWSDPGIHEGLMLDYEAKVIEGTMTNLFLVRAGRLLTPDLSGSGVAGIMRALILESAESLGIAVAVRPIQVDELTQADELFVTNSVIGIWPIVELEQFHFEIGPVCRSLQTRIAERRKENT